MANEVTHTFYMAKEVTHAFNIRVHFIWRNSYMQGLGNLVPRAIPMAGRIFVILRYPQPTGRREPWERGFRATL